ncbi:hypothetical protein SUGI_0043950 [Cryptomeria japonica]|nr:hypothetical protein SUGI_0043950 [Cryptomeria japonica]
MSRGREAHLLEIEGSALSLHLVKVMTMARAILGGVLNRGPWAWTTPNNCRGLLPNPKLEKSVLSICVNTSALAYMIPLGFGVVVSFPQEISLLHDRRHGIDGLRA